VPLARCSSTRRNRKYHSFMGNKPRFKLNRRTVHKGGKLACVSEKLGDTYRWGDRFGDGLWKILGRGGGIRFGLGFQKKRKEKCFGCVWLIRGG